MRSSTGPQWLIRQEVSWEVNYLLWLRRQPEAPSDLSPRQWTEWEIRAAAKPPGIIMAEAVAGTAPDDASATWSVQMWRPFVRCWDERRLALEDAIRPLHGMEIGRRLLSVMGNSDRQITLLYADEPGTRCTRAAAGTWVVGLGYLDSDAFLALIERLKDEP